MYLDNAATAAVREEVLEAIWPYLSGAFGNPSSSHQLGHEAAVALGEARQRVAGMLGCRPGEVVFTSGGTEADNLAIKGLALARPRGRHLVTVATEHEAVLASCDYLHRHHGFEVTVLGVDADGLLDPASVAAALRPDTTLVSVALANNEIGTVQPVVELAAEAHRVGALMHTDAVQAAGWLSLDVHTLEVDALSISGHKFGATKGIGAAFIAGKHAVEPVLHGGGQEAGRRSGTENVLGAVGFGVAALLAERDRVEYADRLTGVRDAFIAQVLAEVSDARLTGHAHHRLPGHASFAIPGVSGESLLIELERRGVLASSGSACAAGRDEPSHVLLALGLDAETAQSAIRFTFGVASTAETLLPVAAALSKSVAAVLGAA